jgi:hypothetical protein
VFYSVLPPPDANARLVGRSCRRSDRPSSLARARTRTRTAAVGGGGRRREECWCQPHARTLPLPLLLCLLVSVTPVPRWARMATWALRVSCHPGPVGLQHCTRTDWTELRNPAKDRASPFFGGGTRGRYWARSPGLVPPPWPQQISLCLLKRQGDSFLRHPTSTCV